MAGQFTKLRVETLEDRRLLNAAPLVDLNGAAPGADFAVERVDNNGLVALVSHDMVVADDTALDLSAATISIANARAGDTLGALTHDTNITAAYADGVLQLAGFDSLAHYQQVLRTVRFNSSASRNLGDQVDISFVVSDGVALSDAAHSIVTVIAPGTATVAGRHLFYNNSKYDGNDPDATLSDDLAIAPDKQALAQGQTASLANYTSYSRGINGLMVDLAGSHGAISADDFVFQIGNNDHPDTWFDAPAPTVVVTRSGAGEGGSDRVEILWADGAIENQWLQVRVAANTHTGLATPDTFLFGNSRGESGNSTADAHVTPVDINLVFNRMLHGQTASAIDDPLDFSRDGIISPQDALLALNRVITASPDVNLINVEPISSERINTTISTGVIITTSPTYPFPIQVFQLTAQLSLNGQPTSPGSTVNFAPATAAIDFPRAMSMEGGAAGEHSALNTTNYRLFKDDVEQPGSLLRAEDLTESLSPSTPSKVTLTFVHPLTPGAYRLVALGVIYTSEGQPMSGASTGEPGSSYVATFSVAG